MIPTPKQLLAEIKTGEIPLAKAFASVDCNSLFEKRDSDSSFDTMYREIWAYFEKLKFILNRDPTEVIRQNAFLAVSDATQQHEITSYVSDDFELIAWKSHGLVDHQLPIAGSKFIEWLYSQYKAGIFPCPPYSEGGPEGGK